MRLEIFDALHEHAMLLGLRRERPRCRTAKNGNELAPSHELAFRTRPTI
jgi:hypothetical protein